LFDKRANIDLQNYCKLLFDLVTSYFFCPSERSAMATIFKTTDDRKFTIPEFWIEESETLQEKLSGNDKTIPFSLAACETLFASLLMCPNSLSEAREAHELAVWMKIAVPNRLRLVLEAAVFQTVRNSGRVNMLMDPRIVSFLGDQVGNAFPRIFVKGIYEPYINHQPLDVMGLAGSWCELEFDAASVAAMKNASEWLRTSFPLF
jgi:hypothetical protein